MDIFGINLIFFMRFWHGPFQGWCRYFQVMMWHHMTDVPLNGLVGNPLFRNVYIEGHDSPKIGGLSNMISQPNPMVTSQVISASLGHVESRSLYKMNLKQHNVGSHPAPEFVGWVEVGEFRYNMFEILRDSRLFLKTICFRDKKDSTKWFPFQTLGQFPSI